MNKAWWTVVALRFPYALESAKAYFQAQYQNDWRKEFKKPEKQLEFFRARGVEISIYLRPDYLDRPRYGYRLRGLGFTIQRDNIFIKRTSAAWEVTGFAYSVLNRKLKYEANKAKYKGWRGKNAHSGRGRK